MITRISTGRRPTRSPSLPPHRAREQGLRAGHADTGWGAGLGRMRSFRLRQECGPTYFEEPGK
ncbi:hypothetical protein ACH470_32695 [Streptomyces bottropensis]|uniref:hypothetical protein n=1 Tax=Streptomyces bottropensis TaxID=42235 RepID=UPI00378E5B0A